MIEFGMVGKLSTQPENRETLVALLTQAAELMKSAAGCQLYVVSTDVNQAGDVWVMELWDSQEAHDESLKLPAVRELITQALPLLTARPDGATLRPLAGKGL